jgi:hypothetical protein
MFRCPHHNMLWENHHQSYFVYMTMGKYGLEMKRMNFMKIYNTFLWPVEWQVFWCYLLLLMIIIHHGYLLGFQQIYSKKIASQSVPGLGASSKLSGSSLCWGHACIYTLIGPVWLEASPKNSYCQTTAYHSTRNHYTATLKQKKPVLIDIIGPRVTGRCRWLWQT